MCDFAVDSNAQSALIIWQTMNLIVQHRYLLFLCRDISECECDILYCSCALLYVLTVHFFN